jgi:hypothetical protein
MRLQLLVADRCQRFVSFQNEYYYLYVFKTKLINAFKKTNYGRAFLNDSNIEPTLMDTTNFTRQFNATASKNTSEKPVSNNYEGDSLDELTFMEQIK